MPGVCDFDKNVSNEDIRNCSRTALKSGGGCLAKHMECVELAPAVACQGRSTAGASSTHSIRFAPFGCGFPLCAYQWNCYDEDGDPEDLPSEATARQAASLPVIAAF